MIDREYVRTGMRARSQEIASRELGPRLQPEMLRAREETIDKERWTEIDRSRWPGLQSRLAKILGFARLRPTTKIDSDLAFA